MKKRVRKPEDRFRCNSCGHEAGERSFKRAAVRAGEDPDMGYYMCPNPTCKDREDCKRVWTPSVSPRNSDRTYIGGDHEE